MLNFAGIKIANQIWHDIDLMFLNLAFSHVNYFDCFQHFPFYIRTGHETNEVKTYVFILIIFTRT